MKMKQIENYPNYNITNDGRVWSRRRSGTKGGWKALWDDGNGYLMVKLSKNGKHKNHLVHRLVGQAFVLNPLNKPQINHKDGNKLNNDYTNLEWVTHQENADHAKKNNLMAKGERNGNSKLTQKQVNEIRANHISKGVNKRKPWKKYDIGQAQYHRVLKGVHWKETD